MSHALTEVPTRGTVVNVPDAGDPRTAASVVNPMQAMTNRIANLEGRAIGAADFSTCPPLESAQADGWSWSDGLWIQSDVASARRLYIGLANIPVGSSIVLCNMQINGSVLGGTHSALPATKPKIELVEAIPVTATTTAGFSVIASATDASASTGAYDVSHTVGFSGAFLIHTGRRYALRVSGETGANSISLHLALLGISISYQAL